jgi:signal transduction histidine kinase
MKKRTQDIGGKIEIRSENGVSINFTVPI